jgi:hypothetical protein
LSRSACTPPGPMAWLAWLTSSTISNTCWMASRQSGVRLTLRGSNSRSVAETGTRRSTVRVPPDPTTATEVRLIRDANERQGAPAQGMAGVDDGDGLLGRECATDRGTVLVGVYQCPWAPRLTRCHVRAPLGRWRAWPARTGHRGSISSIQAALGRQVAWGKRVLSRPVSSRPPRALGVLRSSRRRCPATAVAPPRPAPCGEPERSECIEGGIRMSALS